MNAAADWWKTFFQGVPLDMWRRAITPEMTRADADFLQRVLKLPPGGRVLDVPCGTGRLALELARRGYTTCGVDIASDYITEARASAERERLPATFTLGDMRELPATADFDGAFCFGNSFGYLEDEGTLAFVNAVARAVKQGAGFVIDFGAVAESLLPTLLARRWYKLDDIFMLIDNRYDHVTGRLETEYTFIRDGVTDTRRGFQRAYTYRQLADLLTQVGFRDVEGFGSLEGEPYKLGAPRLLLAARKA
jgi:SAM-dependent methyltransferase